MSARRYTEQQFRDVVTDPGVTTIAEVCRRVGLAPRGGNYESVRRYAAELGLDIHAHLRGTAQRAESRLTRQAWREVSDAAIASAIRDHRSLAAAMRSLGLVPTSTGYGRFRRVLEQFPIDTSHLLGQAANRGRRFPRPRIDPEHYFVRGKLRRSGQVKRRLIEEGLRAHRCEWCRRSTWGTASIPLELDHIDGDRWNNELTNLRLLCPNCHAFTPTYRGRNIGRVANAGGPPDPGPSVEADEGGVAQPG